MSDDTYNPGLHRVAVITALSTLALIFMGGLVTSKGAGMSVPDWPNSFGYNMFLFPPNRWIGGIFYEHLHRLMATVVGMLSILLCIWAWVSERRRSIRWLSVAVLIGVIMQGVLGGLRVVLVRLGLAMIHGCFAQAFLCLVTLVAVMTSRWWIEAPELSESKEATHGRLLLLVAICAVAAIYGQLIVGAVMRHEGAGLAVPDVPLVYGKILPPTTPEQLQRINALRAWKLDLPPVTLGQVWLHYAHRVGALVVTLLIFALAGHIWFHHRHRKILSAMAIVLSVLLITQLSLGLLTVYFRKPADVASAHVAVGALVLATSFGIMLMVIRLYLPRESVALEHNGIHDTVASFA